MGFHRFWADSYDVNYNANFWNFLKNLPVNTSFMVEFFFFQFRPHMTKFCLFLGLVVRAGRRVARLANAGKDPDFGGSRSGNPCLAGLLLKLGSWPGLQTPPGPA